MSDGTEQPSIVGAPANNLCYLDGEILPVSQAGVPVTDLGLQRGYAVFDYFRTFHRIPCYFADHMERFRRSAEVLRLAVPRSDSEILRITERLIEGSSLETPAIRIILTGGDAHDSPLLARPTLLIIPEELAVYPSELFERGIHLMTWRYRRELPEVKSTNYLNSIRLEESKRERNAYDILYFTEEGVTECPRSNFFMVRDGTIITPVEGVLPGITRKMVLMLTDGEVPVETRVVLREELDTANEAFITSTSKGAMPVTLIDGQPVGPGTVGPVTHRVMSLLDDHLRLTGRDGN
jgi:branched-chain amino acid aminotransferase